MRYLVVIALISISACAHKQTFKNLDAWNEKSGESVDFAVRAIKIKSDKADVTVSVKNEYLFTVVIPENSITFEMNGDQGVSEGNPRWVLNSGQIVTTLLKFQLADKETGPATITLRNITRGVNTTVTGVNSNTDGVSGAIGGRHIAMGISNSKTKSESYVKKSAIEGESLPPVTVEIAD